MKVKDIPKELQSNHNIKPISKNAYDMPALWFEDNIIKLIDQRVLPHNLQIYEAKNYEDVAFVISDMVVRGAPAIGAMAAYGIAQAANQKQNIEAVSEVLTSTRPTAFDLFYAVENMKRAINDGQDPEQTANNYVSEIVNRCKKIGEFGNSLINSGSRILTHCNAGALATVDYGTALAPMREANNSGKNIFVYVDETRPRLQGARLTAWELYNEDIAHALIADNAAGFYFQGGEIDLVITGADRIASNGDTANKIGTYEKAVLAHENVVPFYIAAPISTFDLSLKSGSEIPIEERNQDEVLLINDTRITHQGVSAKNPTFDVTPNKYITGYITEFGIISANEIKGALEDKNIE